jgi:hypothetical protein
MYGFKICFIIFAGLLSILFSDCTGGKGGGNKGSKTDSADTRKTVERPVSPPAAINVYIENSGSMDGYVKGVTEFEQSIYSYLSDISIADVTDELNLFYINSEIIRYGSDIDEFIEKLEPSVFRLRGGNRHTSDIANVLRTVLAETKKDTVSILITDGIFSPGRGIDADQYLVNQQIGIKSSVAEYLREHPGAAMIVYQLISNFNGTYYDKEDRHIQIDEQRPFYIWVIGDAGQVRELRRRVPDNKFKGGGVEHVFSITEGNEPVKYAVKPGSGTFRPDRNNPKTTITGWKKDSKGKGEKMARFSINADLSKFLLDDDYLMDKSHYWVSDRDFMLTVTRAASNDAGYTHSLNLSSPIVKKNVSVSVMLLTEEPRWVEEVNDDDGSAPAAGKTYGIKYQIRGVYEAFTRENNCYTEIKISIK